METNSRKTSAIIISSIAAVLIGILIFQMLEDPDADYEMNLLRDRKAKDEYFRSDPGSPLSTAQKMRFKGLNYYDIDRDFRVYATYEENPSYEKVDIIRTGGDTVTYIVAGWLHFELQDQDIKLLAYTSKEQSSRDLFIPFRDGTRGNGTYGGGRYIDTRKVKGRELVLLDFNTAYNPYCVYNHEYTCPIPPPENDLDIAITAGEKDYSDKI